MVYLYHWLLNGFWPICRLKMEFYANLDIGCQLVQHVFGRFLKRRLKS